MRSSKRPASLALQCFIALLVVALVRPPVAVAAPPDLLTHVALAATGPRIAVVVVSQDAKAAAQQGALEGAAQDALERATRFTVVPAHDAFNPVAAKKREERLADSQEKLKAGKQALDDLDNVKATESFTQALEALQEADLSRQFPALIDGWTMKAAGHATGGENGPAKKDIESVIGVSPRAEFSPTFFPPDLLKFVEAQRKLAGNAKGELLVRTEPPGARVWVDGAYRGVSPVTIAGLSAAKHFVTASLGGYALAQAQTGPGEEVLSLASAELGPGWKRALTDIKKDPEGPTRDASAQALGRAAQLDQVLLVVAKKSTAGEKLDLIALRLEVRDGHNASYRVGTVSPGDPESLASFFDALTGKDTKRDGKDPVHHFKGGGGSQVKTIAGISLLGLGVAALATGGAFGVMANSNANAYRATPQTRRLDSENLARDGRTFAVVADVSFLVGIAAAATGGVLLLTNSGGGADDAPATPDKKGAAANDDARRRELDRRAAEERRASEERRKEDERRREDEKKREEERKKESDAKAAEDKRRADEDEAAKKKAEEESSKKLSKKEQAALEKKKREEEARQKKEEELARKEEEKRAAEEKKRLEEEERAKKAEEAKGAKLTKKQQREEEERKKKEEEEAKKKAEEEEKARAEAERKKKEEERKKREEAEKKKREEDHDDLRNY